MINTLNSRELAGLIWLVVIGAWVLPQKKPRESGLRMLKVLFSNKLLIMNISMCLYVTLLVLFLYKINFWSFVFLKDTIFWVLGAAFVLLMDSNKANQADNFFKNIIWNSLKLIVLLEFLMNMYTFHIVIELALIPLLILTVVSNVFSERKEEYKIVKNFLNNLLSFVGLSILIFSVYNVIKNHKDFSMIQSIHSFMFTPILTIGYLPFIYLFALIMLYETLFIRVNIFAQNDEIKKYVKRKLLLKCHINLSKLKRFSKEAINLRFNSKNDVDEALININI